MWAGIPAEMQERVVAVDPRGRGGARVIPINRHRIWQLVADAGLIALAWCLAFELRFDQGVPRYYDTLFQRTILIVVAIKLVVFVLFGFYDRWWRYVSIRDMWARRPRRDRRLARRQPDRLLLLARRARCGCHARSRSWTGCSCSALIAGTRLLARSVIERPGTGRLVARGKEVLVVGAGDAGQLVDPGAAAQPPARLHADRR